MKEYKNKVYTFSVMNEDGSGRIEITRDSNWEGLQPWAQLNMLKALLIFQSYTEDAVRAIRDLSFEELEKLDMKDCDVFEEWRP